jgi:hypothetical protein
LPVGDALALGLHAVVDGVAQQVAERRLELFEHVAVDLGVLADDLQAHALAELVAESRTRRGKAPMRSANGRMRQAIASSYRRRATLPERWSYSSSSSRRCASWLSISSMRPCRSASRRRCLRPRAAPAALLQRREAAVGVALHALEPQQRLGEGRRPSAIPPAIRRSGPAGG